MDELANNERPIGCRGSIGIEGLSRVQIHVVIVHTMRTYIYEGDDRLNSPSSYYVFSFVREREKDYGFPSLFNAAFYGEKPVYNFVDSLISFLLFKTVRIKILIAPL